MKKAQKNQDNTFILHVSWVFVQLLEGQPCSQSPLAGSEMCCFVGQKPSADSRSLVLEGNSFRGLEKRKVKIVSQRGMQTGKGKLYINTSCFAGNFPVVAL